MTITNIISAIGNTSSIYPLLVRDCGIEIPSKVYLTYQENKNDKDIAFLATRERVIDEYATSAIWLGGIPFVEKLVNKFLIQKRGFNPDVNLKLFEKSDCQGIDFNIEKFQGKVSKEVIDDLKKVRDNKATYQKLLSGKFIAATAIPIALMGFVLPKMVFALTAKTKAAKAAKKEREEKALSSSKSPQTNASVPLNKDVFSGMSLRKNKPTAFTGNFSSTIANFTTYQKMATIDGGYAAGRVITSRKKNEAVDIAFKMTGMMLLNFVAPKLIEKMLDNLANKALNLDVKLDPLILEDKNLISQIKSKTLELPATGSGKDLLEFVDNNPDALFSKLAVKFEKVKLLKEGIRDPRAYVNIKDLGEFRQSIEDFSIKALTMKDVERFAKKAKAVKSLNILANVGISSFLLAYCLPKVQYAFREWFTGSKLEPGIVDDTKKAGN